MRFLPGHFPHPYRGLSATPAFPFLRPLSASPPTPVRLSSDPCPPLLRPLSASPPTPAASRLCKFILFLFLLFLHRIHVTCRILQCQKTSCTPPLPPVPNNQPKVNPYSTLGLRLNPLLLFCRPSTSVPFSKSYNPLFPFYFCEMHAFYCEAQGSNCTFAGNARSAVASAWAQVQGI